MTDHLQYDLAVPAPVVRTTAGLVQGRWQNASSAAYLGIPFASAPVGELRFAAPKPHPAWEGVRPAMEYGPTPQRRPFGPAVTIPEPSIPGEYTLNVNVFTPAPRDRGAKLPVFVWIHGGGYFAGSPSSPWYNGRAFNARGIVTVSVSYRLGFDGFGWMEGAPLNRGMLDQILALEWVRDNIAEFGGDPDKVTIGGQSAGGGNVQALMASPKAAGLFRGVISESGPAGTPSLEQAMAGGRAMAERVGVEPTREAWLKVGEDTILDNEREINQAKGWPATPTNAGDFLKALRDGFEGEHGMVLTPLVDGEFLTEPIADAIAHGSGRDVALLAGTTRNEFSFPLPGPAPRIDEAVAPLKAAGMSDKAVERFANEVHRIGAERTGGQFMTEWMFRVGLARLAENRMAAGAGERTWLYDYAQQNSTSGSSVHCDEIPYAFDALDAPKAEDVLGPNPSRHFAKVVNGIWARFIADGTVDRPSLAEGGPTGAIRLQGEAIWDPEAYLFERELLASCGHIE